MARSRSWQAALGKIPSDFVLAKASLRDRIIRRPEHAAARSLALRSKGRYTSEVDANVVGVGVGEKVTGGQRTGALALKVLVAKKFAKARIPRAQLLPEQVDGVPVDVEAVGYPRKLAVRQRGRFRPVIGGVSTGLTASEVGYRYAGTLGVLVIDSDDDRTIYGLSNNHVLADENRARDGATVLQPATIDAGTGRDAIGFLDRYVPLRFDNRQNWMDAALAVVDVRIDRTIADVGAPTGTGTPVLNSLVRKSGRTSGLTEGIVRAVQFDVFNVEYDGGMVRVDDCIVIEGTNGSFSRPGDSGSVVVDAAGKVVALLFAGSDVATFATPIRRVLRRFRVRIAR